jgi:transposase-like protein
MTNPAINPQTKAKIISWIADGTMTRKEAAERVGCSSVTVGQWCRDAGVRAKRRRSDAEGQVNHDTRKI